MRTVTHRLLRTLLASVFIVSVASAVDSPFTGAFIGTGRACYGGLHIRPRTISWLTPFSQCQKSCRFDVLYLDHPDIPNLDIDWGIIGYLSLESYETDKRNGYKAPLPNSLSCSLVTR